MKKKLLLRLCLMTAIVVSLYSCMSDEITLQENPSEALNATRFSSKSLWEEDEKYISKVKDIYAKNADENYIQQKYGTIFWDYATTMDQFDESYLMVPVLKNNKVVYILEVFREKNRVYFQFSADDLESNEFFQTLIFDRDKIKAAESSNGKDTFAKTGTINVSVCKKYTIIVGYVEGASGEQYPIENTKTICKFVEMALPASQCLGLEDPATGECMGAGSGGGESGYEYPEPPEEEDPCEKIKAQSQNANFQAKITNLNTKINNSSESGFRVGKPVPGSGQTETQYQELNNKPGTNVLDFKIFNTTYGIMHSHYDGLIPIFSPGDINLFIQLLKNAQANNIPLNEVFLTVVTIDGVYQLRGDGIDIFNLSMYTDAQIEAFNTIYSEKLGNPNISKTDLQKEFLKFMKENMNIDGAKLYETDNNGNSKQLLLNGNNLSTPNCP